MKIIDSLFLLCLVSAKEYQIVKFINDEEGNDIMSIDCVLSKWVFYDEKSHTCITKFMLPPYNKKRKAKLYNLIATKFNALEHWPCYPIYLKGEAGKHTNYCNIYIISFLFNKQNNFKINSLL